MVIVWVLVMLLDYMLFDEVILVFDLQLVGEVLDIMCLFVEEGMIMVLVIYEICFVCDVFDWVVFFCNGLVYEIGIFDQVIGNLQWLEMVEFFCLVF